jgi:hypothetical protein
MEYDRQHIVHPSRSVKEMGIRKIPQSLVNTIVPSPYASGLVTPQQVKAERLEVEE